MTSPGVLLVLTPHTSAGFHARNNQFQRAGPMGFTEQRALPNNEVYMRIDLPGADEDDLTHAVDNDKRIVLVVAKAPRTHHEASGRRYSTAFGLACDCCVISGVEAKLRNGVLRMLLKKSRMASQQKPLGSNICDRRDQLPVAFKASPPGPSPGRDFEENPYVVEGSKTAYETKDTEEGGVYVRVDMPGAGTEEDDHLRLFLEKGEVRFMGRSIMADHDSGRREYVGAVCPFPFPPIKQIKTNVFYEMKNGVLRMTIPPPS